MHNDKWRYTYRKIDLQDIHFYRTNEIALLKICDFFFCKENQWSFVLIKIVWCFLLLHFKNKDIVWSLVAIQQEGHVYFFESIFKWYFRHLNNCLKYWLKRTMMKHHQQYRLIVKSSSVNINLIFCLKMSLIVQFMKFKNVRKLLV